jgi:peptidyl-prolyl cis-trans isomerase D
MLLSLMRKHAKSWLIKFLIAIIAIVFIFYFGYSFTSRDGVKVAFVNGEYISGQDYNRAYRNLLQALQREYKSVWSENLIKAFDLENRAFNNLVNEKLVTQEARNLGLDVTEKEIQDRIIAYPAFQFKGRFDEERYQWLLRQNGMKAEVFEAEISHQLLREKVEQFLTTFLPVTDNEVLDQYNHNKQQIKIGYVHFQPEKFKESVELDQSGLGPFFDDRKENYRVPEKIKLAYIVIAPETFKENAVPSEQQITEYFEDNQEMFKQDKEVKARHILFKLSKDISEEEEKKIKEKALSVLKMANEGDDFAALAKEYSEGPTGEKGGDLGFFTRGRMVKPFEEAAFKMKKDEISDLVKTSFGYHIIWVEDIREARTKTLDEAKKQITENLTNIVTTDLAHEKGLSLIDQMPYDVDLVKYASEHKMPIKHTDYFSQNENIPGIGNDDKLRQLLFSLEKGDVSELIESKNIFYIIQVADNKPSYLPELDEVRKKVEEDFILHLAQIKAKSTAESFLTQLKEGKNWNELAKKNKLTPKSSDFITRNDVVPDIGYNPGLQEAAFSLNENNKYPEDVLENARGAFVIRWEGKKGIDEEKYLEEKEDYRQSLTMARDQMLIGGWLENLKRKAEIKDLRSNGSQ